MGQGTEEQLTTRIEGTREDLSRNLDALTDRVSPSQVVERRKQAAKGRFRSVRDKVMGSAQDARQSTADGAQSAVGAVERRATGNPLAAGLVAFGAGMVVSSLLPPSEKETELAGQAVDRAKEHGRPVMDQARQVGQEMGGHLKESAGQAAQEVKDEGVSSAQSVRQDVKSRTR